MLSRTATVTPGTETMWASSRAGGPVEPRFADRVLARLRARQLDRELAAGADPAGHPQLAARARALSRNAARSRIATGLERLALSPEQPYRGSSLRPARSAARANRQALLELAERLRRERALYAPGVASLRLLLVDGTGPAYTDRHGEALARALQVAGCRLTG